MLTLTKDAAQSAMAWSDPEFLAEVQRRFGFRLGRFLKVGRRVPYPLSLTQSDRTSAPRCVIIGNAAQGLHPVAGMGFNLGLRDVASLAELIAENARDDADPGSATLLREYDAWRRADRGGVIAFTDGLVRLFSNPLSSVSAVAQLGTARVRSAASRKIRAVAPQHRRRRPCSQTRPRRGADVNRGRSPEFDVIIVGAGVIGTVMASLLLARKLSTPGRVAVVADQFAAAPHSSADWDLRVFALSRASERLLKVCGIWNLLPATRVFPYERMCVLDASGTPTGPGSLTFDCAELGEPNLGYIVDGKALQWQCLQAARAAGVVLIEGAVEAISAGDDAGDAFLERRTRIARHAAGGSGWNRFQDAGTARHRHRRPCLSPRCPGGARANRASPRQHRLATVPEYRTCCLSAAQRRTLLHRVERRPAPRPISCGPWILRPSARR